MSNKPTIHDFMDNLDDFGTKAPTEPMTEEAKKLSAIMIALNAALYQLLIEGIIPPMEQVHFMMHFQEFAGKLWKGESLKLPGNPQTLSINSTAGQLFAESGVEALTKGEENATKLRDAIRGAKERYTANQASDGNEQTTLEQNNDKKPTVH